MYIWQLVSMFAGVRVEPQWCGRGKANQLLSQLPPQTILSRVALIFGITVGSDGKADISDRIGRFLFRWCMQGFPPFCDGDEYRLLSQVHGL